jgi:ATPase subunit of ABC transporter with duplicated ATPase domains
MLLSAEHISINFGSRQLLSDVDLYLNEGDKLGVIGVNGTGKSTLLKVLAGVLEPDSGTVSRDPNVQVSLLSQNPDMQDDATVLEQVFLSFPAEFRALNAYEACSMLNKLGITDMEIGSFMKKFKDKKFAAKCDREVIKKGCDMLGMEVRDVAAICIEAMKAYADQLQIGPKN